MPSITLSDEESDHDDEDGTIAFGQMEDREEEEDLRYIGEGREETYVDSEVREANEKKEVKDRVGLKGKDSKVKIIILSLLINMRELCSMCPCTCFLQGQKVVQR